MDFFGPDDPVFVISVVSRRFGISAQMLRIFEREGLIEPARTENQTRLYSENNLRRLERICELTQVYGVNLAGVKVLLQQEEKKRTR